MEPSVVETREYTRRQRPRVVLQKQLRLKHETLILQEETPVKRSPVLESFDTKIWTRIAYFVPRMKHQPYWQAWTEYRTLNKIFKMQIEDYYARHYLKYMSVKIDGGMHYDEDEGKVELGGRFELANPKARIATFHDDEVAEEFAGWYEAAMKTAMHPFPTRMRGPDYKPKVIVQIRRELTDLFPIDLQYSFAYPNFIIQFDWRMYLCTFFDEQKRIEAANSNPYKAHLSYATQLREEIDKGELDMIQAFKMALERVLPSAQRCLENAFVLTRRKRRLRIGMKVHDWLEDKDKEWRENYAKYGENAVERSIKDSRLWVELEEFSDEEDELPDENAQEYWETTDDCEGSSSEAEDSDGESDSERAPTPPRRSQQDSRKFLLSKTFNAKQQQEARKHQRQQSSFDAKALKRTKTGQP